MPHHLKFMGTIGVSGLFYDRISAADVAAFLGTLGDDGEVLYVSPIVTNGGSWVQTAAIRQLFEDETRRRPVVFRVYGEAASGGAHIVIGTQGARVEMARDATLLIHSPSIDIGQASSGEHAAHAVSLQQSAESIARAIAARAPSVDADELTRQLTERSQISWYTVKAEEAVELGLADAIIDEPDPELAAEAAEAGAALASSQETTQQEGASMASAQLPLRQTAPTPQAGVPVRPPEQSPPPTPAPATPQPEPQAASPEEQSLFARFKAWMSSNPEPEPQPAPAASVQPAAVIPPEQVALPFAPAIQPMQASATVDASVHAMMQTAAETYAATKLAPMVLTPEMRGHAAALGPMKLAEMQAAANLRTAEASGDAATIATARQQHAAAASSLQAFEGALETSAAAMAAAAQPLTTANATAPAAAAVGSEEKRGTAALQRAMAALKKVRPEMAAAVARQGEHPMWGAHAAALPATEQQNQQEPS